MQKSVIPETEMRINNKIMDSIVRKYNPEHRNLLEQMQENFNNHGRTTENSDYGLEKIAKHLHTLSHGRLSNVENIRAP